MIILADVGTVAPEIRERLNAWIDQGGVLVRFAGPRLAQAEDDLVPVKLRKGGRTLGGSLTWEKPQHCAPPSRRGTAHCRRRRPKGVTADCQVLQAGPARCSPPRAGPRWKTARRSSPASYRGEGLVGLFYVGADLRWSDLPMSGTFVEMLRRVVDMSGYAAKPGPGVAAGASAETVGAAAHPRRLRRVRPATGHRKAAACWIIATALRLIVRPASLVSARRTSSPWTRSPLPTASPR